MVLKSQTTTWELKNLLDNDYKLPASTGAGIQPSTVV